MRNAIISIFVLSSSLLLLGLTGCFAQKKTSKHSSSTTSQATASNNQFGDTIARAVVEKPQYPGGHEAMLSFIHKTKKFPQDAVNDGVEGTVIVEATVLADGRIGYVKVLTIPHRSLMKEAIRVVRAMPKWIPGKRNGNPVDMQIIIRIDFHFLR